jgi:hypothetical protein
MKKYFLIFMFLSIAALAATEWNPMIFKSTVAVETGPLTIGGTTPDADSLLELQSTTKGSIFAPKMTEVQRNAITTPPAGLTIYNTDTDKYNYYDGVQWAEVGSGSGGSGDGLNYYEDFQADIIANLTEFDDISSIGDIEGGTAANLSTVLNTSTPISEAASYRISKSGANAQFEGVTMLVDDTLDNLAKSGKTLVYSFNYRTSANYNATTEQVSVYYFRVGLDSTAQACNGRTLGGSISAVLPVASVPTQFSCALNLTSAVTAVRIGLVVTGTGTSTWDLDVDTIKLGVDQTVPAPIVTDWESCTLTYESMGSVTGAETQCKRTTSDLSVRGWVTLGTPSAAPAAFVLPNSWTINTAVVGTAQSKMYGTAFVANSTAVAIPGSTRGPYAIVTSTGISTSRVYIAPTVDSDANLFVIDNASTYLLSSGKLAFEFTVPITQFANGSALVSTTQADYETMKAKIYRGSSNQTIGSASATKVAFNTIEYGSTAFADTTNNRITVRQNGTYKIESQLYLNNTTSDETYQVYIRVNGVDVNTEFERHQGADSTIFISSTRQLNAGDFVEIAVDSSSDTSYDIIANQQTSWLSVTAIPDFSTFGVYGLYEIVTANSSTTAASSSGANISLTGNGVPLTPGTWRLTPEAIMSRTTGTSNLTGFRAIWSETQNTFTNLGTSSNIITDHYPTSTPIYIGTNTTQELDHFRAGGQPIILTLTTSDTIYLNAIIDAGTPSNFSAFVSILAERIK